MNTYEQMVQLNKFNVSQGEEIENVSKHMKNECRKK